jgi:septal ring factor EnvC (AmiA/AmiB activator)
MPGLTFPLPVQPTNLYWLNSNQTGFGTNRTDHDGRKRKHAGIDLEAPFGTPVLAMADGVVLRTAPFYDGTYVVEVRHPGLGIVRYGEVQNPSVIASAGQYVKQGQKIGTLGRRGGAPRCMLHLELYSNEWDVVVDPTIRNAHPLYVESNPPFKRRADMLDPTETVRSATPKYITDLTLPSIADRAEASAERKAAESKRKAANADRQAELNRRRLLHILRNVSLIKTTSFGRTR